MQPTIASVDCKDFVALIAIMFRVLSAYVPPSYSQDILYSLPSNYLHLLHRTCGWMWMKHA